MLREAMVTRNLLGAGIWDLRRRILTVRGSTGRRGPRGTDPQPCASPANQETSQRRSGGCFYGGDLTESMVRTKPETIHTYIYYIQRRSPGGRRGGGGAGSGNRKRPAAPPTLPRPLHLPGRRSA